MKTIKKAAKGEPALFVNAISGSLASIIYMLVQLNVFNWNEIQQGAVLSGLGGIIFIVFLISAAVSRRYTQPFDKEDEATTEPA